jgi:hypothetical protein
VPKLHFAAVLFSSLISGIAVNAQAIDRLFEEQAARSEETRIIRSPISGIENRLWFNYIGNVNETQKELVSDLRNSSDIEDLRDAWDEYRIELSGERRHYIDEMRERGYRYVQVDVID